MKCFACIQTKVYSKYDSSLQHVDVVPTTVYGSFFNLYISELADEQWWEEWMNEWMAYRLDKFVNSFFSQ